MLYRDCTAILDQSPSSQAAQSNVARWRTIVDDEAGGDEDAKAAMMKSFRGRRNWPDGLKRYWASTYEMDAETWERVADFIERAATSLSP